MNLSRMHGRISKHIQWDRILFNRVHRSIKGAKEKKTNLVNESTRKAAFMVKPPERILSLSF